MNSARLTVMGILFGTLLLLIAQIGVAAYITDKLLAGLYASPDLTTEPIRALPNGTPMEVLEEMGKLSRVRLGDNSEGWVETRFVTQEKPARTMLLELQAKYADLKRQADSGYDRQQNETPATTQASLETAQPMDQPVEAQQPNLQPQNSLLQGAAAEAAETEEQQRLRLENAQLRARIQRIRTLVSGEPETESHQRTDTFQPWILPLIMLGLLVSFIGGIAFKNYRIARRARQVGKTG